MKMYKSIIFIMCLSIFPAIKPDVLFFDVGGTLAYPNTGAALTQLGLMPLVKHFLSFWYQNPFGVFQFKRHMQDWYIATLRQIPSPCEEKPNYRILLPDGKPMPLILQNFLSGAITQDQATAQITQYATNNRISLFNDSENTLRIFLSMAQFSFVDFVNYLQLLPCASLLARCAQQRTATGQPRHVCILVSNWAQEHIEPFKKKFATEITQHIGACVFSCDGYGPKPLASFYQRCNEIVRTQFPEQYNKPWFFIDDQQENLDAAKQYMGHNIVCMLPNNAPNTLIDHGVIIP